MRKKKSGKSKPKNIETKNIFRIHNEKSPLDWRTIIKLKQHLRHKVHRL